jgi:hypothetical protein
MLELTDDCCRHRATCGVVTDSRKPQLPLQLPDDVGSDARGRDAEHPAATAAAEEEQQEQEEDDEDAAVALEPTPEEVEQRFERLLAAQHGASDGATVVTPPGGRKLRPTLSVTTETGQRVYLRVQSLPHERTLTPTADEVWTHHPPRWLLALLLLPTCAATLRG